jgi:outer membrane autotransporter protein
VLGTSGGAGGGGAGMGGGLFVSDQSTTNLIYTSQTAATSAFSGNSVNGGAAGVAAGVPFPSPAAPGLALGADIFLMGTLNVQLSSNVTLAPPSAIAGPGSLIKSDLGTLILGNANTYTGLTSILGGRLILNGSLTSNTTVSGGILSGVGTINGNLAAANGGIVAPGNNSIGTLTVNNYVQDVGGVLQIELDAAGNSSLLQASGSAALGGILDVIPLSGSYVDETFYTVLTASSGVSGTFSAVQSPLANVQFIPQYFPTLVQLQVKLSNQVGTIPFKGNAGVVQRYLSSIPTSFSSDLNSVVNQLNTLTDPQIAQALEYFTPALFSGIATDVARNLESINNTFFDPLRVRQSHSSCFWLIGRGNQTKQNSVNGDTSLLGDGNDGSRGFNSFTGGLIGGFDSSIDIGDDKLSLGISAGYDYTDFVWDQSAGSTKINSEFLGAYGLYSKGPLQLGASITASAYQSRKNRNIVFPGFFRTAKSKHGENALSGRIALGYVIGIRNDSHLFPYLVSEYFLVHQNGFMEKGADSLNLFVRRHDDHLLRSELGMGIEVPFTQGMFFFKLGGIYWKKLSGGNQVSSLQGITDTFTVVNPMHAVFEVAPGIGFSYNIAEKLTTGAAYSGQFNNRFQVHNAKVLINWCF